MATPPIPRPPYDPAYQFGEGRPGMPETLNIEAMRVKNDNLPATNFLAKFQHLIHTDISIPSIKDLGDHHSTTLAIFQTKPQKNQNRAAVLFVHGGAQVLGDRFFGVELFLNAICPAYDDVVVASVEYRLAPEHRAPAGAYDCYAALVYLTEHAAEMSIDPSRILVYGISGGAPLAAATSLLARARNGPQICAQMLSVPMLDDREDYASWRQFETGTIWAGKLNRQAWEMVLGPEKTDSEITELQVPSRAEDFSDLPLTFIDVGACEVFRDSAVAFASEIWRAGGEAELHVWPGMYHGAVMIEPDVPISRAAQVAQRNFIERVFGLREGASIGKGGLEESL